MAIYDKEVGLIPGSQERFAQEALEVPRDLAADVRSTVESQFQQMEEAHNRIRSQELTARLTEPTI